MFNPGRMNQKITIQRNIPITNSLNEPVPNWSNYFSPWAEMVTTGGGEFYAAQKINAETTALFKIRYTDKIDTTMRIVLGKRIFEILPPLNDVNNQHLELQISAKEVV